MIKDVIKLMKLTLDVLDELSEDDISALLDKRAHLKVEFPNQKKPARTAAKLTDSFFQKFDSCKTREEARALFEECAFRRADLLKIAKHYDIPLTKESNPQIIDGIIESTIGSRLKFHTLLNVHSHNAE